MNISRGHQADCSMGWGGRYGWSLQRVSTSRRSCSGLGHAATLTGQVGETTAPGLRRNGDVEKGGCTDQKPLRDETTIVVALDQVHYFASFLRRRTCSRPVKGPASCLRESHVRNRQAPLHQVGRVGSNHKEMRVETDSIILRTAALDALTPC